MVAFKDILSYNLEQMRGDDLHNLLTCVMDEYQTDVNGSMLWVKNFLLGAAERFHAAKAALPEWNEPLNSDVKAYCDGLGQWVRGMDFFLLNDKQSYINRVYIYMVTIAIL